ncbi:uncharacterized protein LOC104873628 [Fukomys damarensis]|uniref:uncharacterized protein LOC104873628 n=1 Tax=Fukomys damarensis TaxID=885580 RepID=UPI00053FDB50|nr:uncharacterized protein LOC104873628 [Fukomys damarensis]
MTLLGFPSPSWGSHSVSGKLLGGPVLGSNFLLFRLGPCGCHHPATQGHPPPRGSAPLPSQPFLSRGSSASSFPWRCCQKCWRFPGSKPMLHQRTGRKQMAEGHDPWNGVRKFVKDFQLIPSVPVERYQTNMKRQTGKAIFHGKRAHVSVKVKEPGLLTLKTALGFSPEDVCRSSSESLRKPSLVLVPTHTRARTPPRHCLAGPTRRCG